jgi:CRP/FNR family transcriptional regulator
MNKQKSPHHSFDCESCETRGSSVFSALDGPQLHVLSSSKACRVYHKGEMIFFVNDRPAGLYCIRHGNVKVYKVGGDGREQIIRLVGAGEILGYRSLIAGTPYSSFAMPIEETHICFIPRSELMSLLTTDAAFSMRMMGLLSNELRSAEERIVEIAQKPVRERLAETLVVLLEKYGVEADGESLGIRLTREELANIVGTATESVIRLLSEFNRDGLIEIRGRKLRIVDREGLLAMANVMD